MSHTTPPERWGPRQNRRLYQANRPTITQSSVHEWRNPIANERRPARGRNDTQLQRPPYDQLVDFSEYLDIIYTWFQVLEDNKEFREWFGQETKNSKPNLLDAPGIDPTTDHDGQAELVKWRALNRYPGQALKLLQSQHQGLEAERLRWTITSMSLYLQNTFSVRSLDIDVFTKILELKKQRNTVAHKPALVPSPKTSKSEIAHRDFAEKCMSLVAGDGPDGALYKMMQVYTDLGALDLLTDACFTEVTPDGPSVDSPSGELLDGIQQSLRDVASNMNNVDKSSGVFSPNHYLYRDYRSYLLRMRKETREIEWLVGKLPQQRQQHTNGSPSDD